MAKLTEIPGIPEKVFDLVPVQAHLPTELPPPPAPPTDVAPAEQAIDAVTEHVALLGAAPHLPDFFGL